MRLKSYIAAAGCCILLQLLLLDLIVFVDVDLAECPRFDASNIPKGSTIHVQVSFKKNDTAFFVLFRPLLKQFLFFKPSISRPNLHQKFQVTYQSLS